MRFKTNLLISAIFVALLAFVYFYEIKGGEEREAAAKQAKQLLDFSDHEVVEIEIGRADTMISAVKADDGWLLKTPVETDADEKAIERYLRNLRETEIERVVEDSAAVAGDLTLTDKYGLTNPRLQVRISLADSSPDAIALGSDSPTERYAYAQRSGANGEIFTVRAWRFDNLDKKVFDLRDRRVLAFDRDEVRDFTLQTAKGSITITHGGDGNWEMSTVDRPADATAVDALLSKLGSAEAEAFVVEKSDEAEAELRGLDEPFATVFLHLGEDRAEKRLHIGSEVEDGQRYAIDASRSAIFLVDSTLVNELDKTSFDLREKKPVPVEDRDAIRQIELWKRGEAVFTAGRDTTGGWSITSPFNRDPKSWKLNSLLSDIDEISVVAFTVDATDADAIDRERYGLDSPAVRVRLTDDLDEVIAFSLGAVEGEVFLLRDGTPSVYRVDPNVLDDLGLELNDVSKAPAIAPQPDDTSTDSG